MYAEAEIKLQKLYCVLDTKGLGLHTLGGSSGQSLTAAINKGTLASDINLPPLFDVVRAIHLISYDGVEWWLEPSAYRHISSNKSHL